MDAREQRGLEIAAKFKVVKKGNVWLVPSQTKDGTKYSVVPGEKCTCPDHEVRQVKCKHMWALQYVLQRETSPDGVVTETETIKVTKVSYPQNWTAYNDAQTEEKARFKLLLADLCQDIPQPAQGVGRPRLPLSDMVFACAYKVYSGLSSRRFATDSRDVPSEGLVANEWHFNRVSNYLSTPEITPILQNLVSVSATPLKAVETDFAVDSSGFGTSRFVKWFNRKYGREFDNREWVKAHLMCGVNTHIVTAVQISGWAANDTPYFKPLVEETARQFKIAEVSADKAYLSHKNLELIQGMGATPFIPFKSNTIVPKEESAWARMYHYYMFNREQFLEHYHKRSNVESVFSMIKAKFGDSVRSKSDTGMVNEVLCKVLCHNICVVIQSIHELGIEPLFENNRADLADARKLASFGQ